MSVAQKCTIAGRSFGNSVWVPKYWVSVSVSHYPFYSQFLSIYCPKMFHTFGRGVRNTSKNEATGCISSPGFVHLCHFKVLRVNCSLRSEWVLKMHRYSNTYQILSYCNIGAKQKCHFILTLIWLFIFFAHGSILLNLSLITFVQLLRYCSDFHGSVFF